MPASRRHDDDIDLIASPLTLPNGVVVPNRLVKAAMEEGISGGLPGKHHRRLYKRWGQGGWGIILTGNVAVDAAYPATPHDLRMVDSPHTVPLYTALNDVIISSAAASASAAPLTLVQLSHAGIQSSSVICLSRPPWAPAVGPSSTRPDLGPSLLAWLIERCFWPIKSRRISDPAEWLEIVAKFVEAACAVEEAGWGGVQIHSAHGYLLAEYLSPLTNPDPFPLPGVPDHIPLRLHLLWLILTEINATTQRQFVKALKINCSDFVQGGLDEKHSADIIREIVSWKLIDILEVSGGTYTSPAFAPVYLSADFSSRQSLFSHFTSALIPTLPRAPSGPAIVLTGGLHDRAIIAASIRDGACDFVGIGRPSCVNPELPSRIILNPEIDTEEARVGGYTIPLGDTVRWALGGGFGSAGSGSKGKRGIPLVGAGVSTFWHEWQMCRIGRGEEPDLNLDWVSAAVQNLLWYDILRGGPFGWYRRMMDSD